VKQGDRFESSHRPPLLRILLNWERLFLVAGIIALGAYGGMWAYSTFYQTYETWTFDQLLEGKSASLKDFLSHWFPISNSDKTATLPQKGTQERGKDGMPLFEEESISQDEWAPARKSSYQKSLSQRTGSPIARLQIPSIDLSVMVLEGTGRWTLNRAVGHIDGTALPGQSGNLGIAGHRDSFFRGLRNISENDKITLTTLKGTYQYLVKDIEIVTPSDVRVLNPTPQPTLTLVTCYPFYFVGEAPERFIVKAQLVGAERSVVAGLP
jgi:LPXTG-site transpeptidase (sortase) family protein